MKKQFTRKTLTGLALIGALAYAPAVHAQLAANTYQYSALTGTYTDITGGTAVTAIQTDDAISAALPIGFTFNYCGTDYTQFKMTSNGFLTFGPTITTYNAYNDVSSLASVKPALFPLWDDISGSGGAASYLTTGTAPNRVLTMQCNSWKWYYGASAASISFQIKLYETTNLIQFCYRQESGAISSASATIGIGDNGTGTPGFLTLSNGSSTATASSTLFNSSLVDKPATGQIFQFKPVPPFDMKADSVVSGNPFCSNGSHPVSLAISNRGTAAITTLNIDWTVDGVAQPTVTYTGSPLTNFTTTTNTATVVLGNVFYPTTGSKTIKAWVSQPNGNADLVNSNDTTTAQITPQLQGVDVSIQPRDTIICQGSTITLDAGTYPFNPIYIWNDGSLGQTHSASQSGTFAVKVQNTLGCFDRDTVVVSMHLDPVVNSIAIIDDGGGKFTFNAIGAQNVTSYTWDFDDASSLVPGTGIPAAISHTYTQAGSYNVKLTLHNDCNDLVVTRNVAVGSITGINNVNGLQKELSIFPNPAKSKVEISNKIHLNMKSINIFNVMGQKVLSAQKVNSDHYEMDITSLAAGIYNVIIDTDKGELTKRLEVIK